MEQALIQAQAAALAGEVPVGAVVVHQGNVIAAAHNEVMQKQDVCAHAELLALQRAAKYQGVRFLDQCDLYATLEPCPMCASAISLARIRRLYFGAYDIKGGGVEHGPRIFESSSCFHKPDVFGGIEEKSAEDLLKAFFKTLR